MALKNYKTQLKPPLFSRILSGGALLGLVASSSMFLGSCAQVFAPDTRNVNIPAPQFAQERKRAVNERPDAVMYLPLGDDILVPQIAKSDVLPKKIVGPFELRGETLGGALQLILDETDIPIAFESSEGLERTITITNLKGELEFIVSRVCSLADLYCSFENGMLVVKDTQLFTVTLPPIGEDNEFLTGVSAALEEIVGSTPITDEATRTLVYRASNRTSEVADSYFQRLRSNTALIIFETYIWEVSLNSGNSTGIDWDSIDNFGKYQLGINLEGVPDPSLGTPVSIGLPTTNGVAFDGDNVFQFISEYGAVKTISQPQVTVLSGSNARFRVADTQNYVSEISRSVDQGEVTVSTQTDSVDTGFTFDIASSWDKATVYGNIDILLQEVRAIDTFDDNPDAIVQLPQTTERELSTQVRIRPGDSLLIAGLVREIDNFDKSGPGIQEPLFPSSRTAQTSNVELVFLLRPRVVVYTTPSEAEMISMKREAKLASEKAAAQFLKQVSVDVPAPVAEVSPSIVQPAQETVIIKDTYEVQESKEQPRAQEVISEDEVIVQPLSPDTPVVQAPMVAKPIKAPMRETANAPVIIERVEIDPPTPLFDVPANNISNEDTEEPENPENYVPLRPVF